MVSERDVAASLAGRQFVDEIVGEQVPFVDEQFPEVTVVFHGLARIRQPEQSTETEIAIIDLAHTRCLATVKCFESSLKDRREHS